MRKIIRDDGTEIRRYAPGDGHLSFAASYDGKAGNCSGITEQEAQSLLPDGWQLYRDGPYWRAKPC